MSYLNYTIMKEYYEKFEQNDGISIEEPQEKVEALKQGFESIIKVFYAEFYGASGKSIALDILPRKPLYLEKNCKMEVISSFFKREEEDAKGLVYFASGYENEFKTFIKGKKLENKLFCFTYCLLATLGQDLPRIENLINLCLNCPPANLNKKQMMRIFTALMVKHLHKMPKDGFAPYSKWLWEHHECLKPLEKIKVVAILNTSQHPDDLALKEICLPANNKKLWSFVLIMCFIFLLMNSIIVFSVFPVIGILNLIIAVILVVAGLHIHIGLKD